MTRAEDPYLHLLHEEIAQAQQRLVSKNVRTRSVDERLAAIEVALEVHAAQLGRIVHWLGDQDPAGRTVGERLGRLEAPEEEIPVTVQDATGALSGMTWFLRCAHCHRLYVPSEGWQLHDGRWTVYWVKPRPQRSPARCAHDAGLERWNGTDWVAEPITRRKEDAG
jgi:hypothetical protein